MKVTTEWLAEHIAVESPIEVIVDRLTMAGIEVERCEPATPDLQGVVTARIESVVQHPAEARLQICEVDAAALGRYQVVCGAPNARAGVISFLALPGARIAGNKSVNKSVIREVESTGMLCSETDLGLGDDNSGIVELPAITANGLPLSAVIPIDDQIIELNLTPNRGDCLSMIGVARELSAIFQQPLRSAPTSPVAAESNAVFSIELCSPAQCPRYVGRVIEHVDTTVPTPLWLKERLRRCGLRSINIIVDVTNYTMLELGQPMHAFDLDSLTGGIKVRTALKGETLALLDDSNIDLDDTCLVITDDSGPIALAGIMGGRVSGVETTTSRVLLESAYFDRVAVSRTARRFGLTTDAAHRFERGVDPEGQAHAAEFATRMIVNLCGGRAGPTADVRAVAWAPRRIRFRPGHATAVLGLAVDEADAREIFARLNCVIHDEHQAEHWQVEPPSYRFDLSREVDLIEEIARLRGYDQLPATQPRIRAGFARRTRPIACGVFRQYLVAQGYFEAITYSFIPVSLWQFFAAPEDTPLALSNPISQDMAVMRASLWPGLLLVAQRNLNRQAIGAKLFESGMVFTERNGELSQTVKFAGLAIGPATPEQWGTPSREVDFFDLKQDLANMLGTFGLRGVRFVAAST
ncbi:MAG: phenylalanine--tRNA ligase subunit beta, partial [Gammaproteobacteria bacterium]